MIKDEDQDGATSRQIVVVQGWADEGGRLGTANLAETGPSRASVGHYVARLADV
jgi:hypothetical protein